MPINWKKDPKLIRIAARYTAGSILLCDAAQEAGMNTLDFMEYLTSSGYKSKYSKDDFERVRPLLDKSLDYSPPARRRKTSKTES